MEYYIIRNKLTGAMLPITRARNKTSANLSRKLPPRLFSRREAAQQALQWWLEGEWHCVCTPDSAYRPESWDLAVEKKVSRIPDTMEIVKVELKEL